jgi:acyl-CoA synthetase (AMP-forming)/AMP-acid ligase II
MFTSGSTGIPKGFTFTDAQLDQTSRWYEDIYTLSANSAIFTSLPATYNFTFVAGVFQAYRLGCSLHLLQSVKELDLALTKKVGEYDRCVVLSSPLTITHLIEARGPRHAPNVMFDSGGAPLSTSAIKLFRTRCGDLREGYGLTETASLTHFDREGSELSIGTVGLALPGVTTSLGETPGRTGLRLKSPNVGRRLLIGGDAANVDDWLETGDHAALDAEGRLRILGRSDDVPIQGIWPRDTLDEIGPILAGRCALVQHPSSAEVHVSMLFDLNEEDRLRLRQTVRNLFGSESVSLVIHRNTAVIASRKLARQRTSSLNSFRRGESYGLSEG